MGNVTENVMHDHRIMFMPYNSESIQWRIEEWRGDSWFLIEMASATSMTVAMWDASKVWDKIAENLIKLGFDKQET